MWWITTIGAVVLGTAVTVAAIKQIIDRRQFKTRAVRVYGVVVENDWQRVNGNNMAMPVFDYHTREGHPMRATEKVGTNPPRYRPGTQVVVLYDPSEPYRASLEGMAGVNVAVQLVMLVLGPLFAVGGLVSLASRLL